MSLPHKPLRQTSVSNEDLANGGKASGPRERAASPRAKGHASRQTSQSESYHTGKKGTNVSSAPFALPHFSHKILVLLPFENWIGCIYSWIYFIWPVRNQAAYFKGIVQ